MGSYEGSTVGLVFMFTWPGLVWAVVSAGLTCSRDGCILGSTSWMACSAFVFAAADVVLGCFIFSTLPLHSVSYNYYIERCIVKARSTHAT